MQKIAALTKRYIACHPEIRDCLAMDMVNYSKLARRIARELKIRQIPAVAAACRRCACSIRKEKREVTGIGLLKKSEKRISISNRQAHITFRISEKFLPKVLGELG